MTGRGVGKYQRLVVIVEDDLEEYACSGPSIDRHHVDTEFELYRMKLVNGRAADCPNCNTRYVSFGTTFMI